MAAGAFLRHRVLVALDAEHLVLVVGETGPGQRLGAGAAHETVSVPGLVLVVHPPRGDGLFAADTMFGKLLVVAGAAVNVISFREETLRSYWSFTVGAGEAVVMPRVAFVLHTLCASQYGFVAAVAAWSVFSGAALSTHDAVVLGAEGLFGQRFVTFRTAETLLMPVSALMAELLGLHRDGPMAFGAAVGAELRVAADAHGPTLVADKPLPPEVLPAVETV